MRLGISIFDFMTNMTEPLSNPKLSKFKTISKILLILSLSILGARNIYLETKNMSLDADIEALTSLYNSIEENKAFIEENQIAIDTTYKSLEKLNGLIESTQDLCKSDSSFLENTSCNPVIQAAINEKEKGEKDLSEAKKALAEMQKILDEDEKKFRDIIQNLND